MQRGKNPPMTPSLPAPQTPIESLFLFLGIIGRWDEGAILGCSEVTGPSFLKPQ